MSRIKGILLLVVIFLSNHDSIAQRITDSIEVNGFPVKKGVVYSYDYGGVCRTPNPGISIITNEDSLFHFEGGEVVGVSCYGEDENNLMVVIKSHQNKYFCYANLKFVAVKKGVILESGMFIGVIGNSDLKKGFKELDILIMLNDIQYMPEKKILEYINCNKPISESYYTL